MRDSVLLKSTIFDRLASLNETTDKNTPKATRSVCEGFSTECVATIDEVLTRSKKERREVYYTAINECKIDGWHELADATTWHEEIPDGSIYICDEFYENFPKVQNADKITHYEMLAKQAQGV